MKRPAGGFPAGLAFDKNAPCPPYAGVFFFVAVVVEAQAMFMPCPQSGTPSLRAGARLSEERRRNNIAKTLRFGQEV